MKVKIKRLSEKAIIPSYSINGDAGLDLTAISKELVNKDDHGYHSYGTGLSVEIPEGFVGLLFPRSSISKTGHILANSVGVIDSNYRGEISLRFKTIPHSKEYEEGDRIGQLLIIPYPSIELEEVGELSDTDRGDGGFGHTG